MKRKFLVLILALSTILSTVSASAAEDNDNSITINDTIYPSIGGGSTVGGSTDKTFGLDSNYKTSSSDVEVEAKIGQYYYVTLPKRIDLGTTTSRYYTVKVRGDIFGDATLSVKPQLVNDYYLPLTNAYKNSTLNATIFQSKISWNTEEVASSTSGDISIYFDNSARRAGTYTGTLNYDISLVGGEAKEKGASDEVTDFVMTAKNRSMCLRFDRHMTHDYDIPSTFTFNDKTYRVVGIADNAFQGDNEVETVTVPSSVKWIGAYAFTNCANLYKVTLSEGLETIGEGAFYASTRLENTILPDSLVSVGKDAFFRAGNITVSESTKSIEGFPWSAYESFPK